MIEPHRNGDDERRDERSAERKRAATPSAVSIEVPLGVSGIDTVSPHLRILCLELYLEARHLRCTADCSVFRRRPACSSTVGWQECKIRVILFLQSAISTRLRNQSIGAGNTQLVGWAAGRTVGAPSKHPARDTFSAPTLDRCGLSRRHASASCRSCSAQRAAPGLIGGASWATARRQLLALPWGATRAPSLPPLTALCWRRRRVTVSVTPRE